MLPRSGLVVCLVPLFSHFTCHLLLHSQLTIHNSHVRFCISNFGFISSENFTIRSPIILNLNSLCLLEFTQFHSSILLEFDHVVQVI